MAEHAAALLGVLNELAGLRLRPTGSPEEAQRIPRGNRDKFDSNGLDFINQGI